MSPMMLQLLIAVLTVLPFVMLYWIGRFVSRRRLGAGFRQPRPIEAERFERWEQAGWVNDASPLPKDLSAAAVFYEWAWTDPEAARLWRFRGSVDAVAALTGIVEDAAAQLPPVAAERSREKLRDAVRVAGTWWGGAEQGWSRRPLSLLGTAVGKKQAGLPLLGMEDLTAAPLPLPVDSEALNGAPLADLALLLALLRHAAPEFTHPLAPRTGSRASMMEGMSTQVGSDLGRRLGAGFGAALGPIGSMIGQHVGEMAGRMGGKALASQALPEEIATALKGTEAALSRLGQLSESDALARAAGRPAELVLEFGRELEGIRAKRSRGLRERIWPTAALVLVEELMRVALAELQGYRSAAAYFVATARKSPEPVAGGMILQNPWLVHGLAGGVERLNEARQALNRAAVTIRRIAG